MGNGKVCAAGIKPMKNSEFICLESRIQLFGIPNPVVWKLESGSLESGIQ